MTARIMVAWYVTARGMEGRFFYEYNVYTIGSEREEYRDTYETHTRVTHVIDRYWLKYSLYNAMCAATSRSLHEGYYLCLSRLAWSRHAMPRDASSTARGTSVESEYGPGDSRIRGVHSNESAFFRDTLKDRGMVRE